MLAESAPWVLLVAGFGPALLWAVLVIRAARRPSNGLVVAAFLWGALVAAPAAEFLAARWQLDPITSAPLVEEALKAAPLGMIAIVRVEIGRAHV